MHTFTHTACTPDLQEDTCNFGSGESSLIYICRCSGYSSVLVLTIITAKAGGEQAGDNKTVDHIPILAVESPALSIYAGAWHLSAVGTHFMGLQDP